MSESLDIFLLLQDYMTGCFDLSCDYRVFSLDKRIFCPRVWLLDIWRCRGNYFVYSLYHGKEIFCLLPPLLMIRMSNNFE